MSNEYEKVETRVIPGTSNKLEFKLVTPKYNDWYTMRGLLELEECKLTYVQISKRLCTLRKGKGYYYTLWDAITMDNKKHKSFNDYLNMIPVGSLSHTVR